MYGFATLSFIFEYFVVFVNNNINFFVKNTWLEALLLYGRDDRERERESER